MKIVYVTGCLGFIGSHFVRKCLKMGWYVYGVDKITYAANESLLSEFETYKNFKFEKQDIKDVTEICDCDYIVNFAAESHVGNSIVNSDSFIDTNVAGTKNLLDVLKNKPSNCTQRPVFLHISTDEVYGDIAKGEHTESDILKPSNPYSAAKACSDMLIHAWARTYGIQYAIVRPTNNYGKYQHSEKLIPLIIKNLMRGKKIRLHNKGTPIRNWLHAEDTSEAVLTLIKSSVKNEIYNIAGGFEQTNSETARKVIKAYYGTDDNWEQYIDYSYQRVGQDVRYALNDDKIRNLGWQPKKVFDDEIKSIVDHYKEDFRW
jgi:dTDP-glucose 4,6-dehydratase